MASKMTTTPQRTVHFDFHTMPKVDDVGSDFNGKKFARMLKDAHVGSVTVFAKCNIGFAYYPTEAGIRHPGLRRDLLGEMVEACKKEGIMVLAYFNAGLDHECAIRHRDWCVLPADGTIYKENRLNSFFRKMCLNTAYGDYLVEMTKEVLTRYHVDGLFFDCLNELEPCHGVECLKTMEEIGGDILDPATAKKALHLSNSRFAARIREILPKDKFLYFNCIPFKDQLEYCGHLEIECLPQGAWGYDNFPANVRYARNLGKHVVGLTGRFQGGWGDFGGIRTEASLKFDCLNAISNGVACGIGDHLHPRGVLDEDVYKIVGGIYAEVEKLEPWLTDSHAVAEMGVVIPQSAVGYPLSNWEPVNDPVAGAVRMLAELKHQVDVIDWDMDFSKYKALIFPDDALIPECRKDKVLQYAGNGGRIISSGHSGLSEDKADFALPDVWGVSFKGEEQCDAGFLKMRKAVAGVPSSPVSIYASGISMAADGGTEVLAHFVEPYFNKHWDGYHGYCYTPPKNLTGKPVLTKSGQVFQFSFPIFRSYFDQAYVAYKMIVKACLDEILPAPLLKVEGMPSFARATVTRKGNRDMLHLLSYVPEMRGHKQIIEEPVPLKDVKTFFRLDGRHLSRIYSAPDMEGVDYEVEDGYAILRIPEVNGYKLLVLEYAGRGVS